MTKYNTEKFQQGLQELGIHLETSQMDQFLTYYELLVEWNKVMNLTGITEFEDVVAKHFLDSLSLVRAVDVKQSQTLLDVGTGAGFPGIPLKIAFPHLSVTLLDSLNKRLNFLNCVINKLNLKNIVTIHGRAEDFARKKEYREHFDLVVSRAVANLSTLSEYCLPYTDITGKFISYKSGKIQEELEQAEKAIWLLGGKLKESVRFDLMGTEGRTLLVIEKQKATPKIYPRKAGTPAKEPLGVKK